MKHGGILVKNDLNSKDREIVFSDNEHYYYAFFNLPTGGNLKLDYLTEYTVFIKSLEEDINAKLSFATGESVNLKSFDSADIAGIYTELINNSDYDIQILVAGIREKKIDKPVFHIIRAGDIKTVFKPWGHEYWINQYNLDYSLKEVFLKKGKRTSLQYHHFKQETNVLFDGVANIWYKSNPNVANDDVQDNDIDFVRINALSSVDVVPKLIHRVESVTDVYLYEASTPHLEDVIRVQDDNNRKDGTVESEHKLQICILAAGIGSRMGGLTETINKCLLPIKDKAVISGIIEKFPKTSRFVIALGYKGKQVEDYLLCAYPGYEFKFVYIDNYKDAGSGPGYSLLQCKPFLNDMPFYFTVSDAIYNFDIPFDLHENWVGVTKVNYAISHNYCNLTIENNKATQLIDKEPYINEYSKSFVGLAYLHNIESFWKGINDKYLTHGEHQMTNGLVSLINEAGMTAVETNWVDIGSFEKYIELLESEGGFNFSKMDEYIYFVGNHVIKFFKDTTILSNRVKKAGLNKTVFPEITYSGEQFYSYELIEGKTFYKNANPSNFKDFLKWMKDNLWSKTGKDISKECKDFYKDKTMKRVELLIKKHPDIVLDEELVINGDKCNSMQTILKTIDWDLLINKHESSLIHGDLQFDNVIITPDGSFKLIDWRQDFAGLVDSGDLYYDLAKLYGGLIINYDLIKLNHFSFSEDGNIKQFELLTRHSMKELIEIFEEFILAEGYDLKKVKELVGIIFLNMSPLHHYPFDKLLYSLSNSILNKTIYENKQ